MFHCISLNAASTVCGVDAVGRCGGHPHDDRRLQAKGEGLGGEALLYRQVVLAKEVVLVVPRLRLRPYLHPDRRLRRSLHVLAGLRLHLRLRLCSLVHFRARAHAHAIVPYVSLLCSALRCVAARCAALR